ncbi:MAG: NEW3 domain-containing protein, partial [Clostridiales bacterium]|nr:NEW3 domain-containing protein [Clostridiales bacterium]
MNRSRKTAPVLVVMAVFFALFFMTALPVHAAGGLSISTPYPGTTVTAGKTATFALTLDNVSAVPMNAEVSVSGLPDGWSAQLIGDGNQVSRVYVGANDTATVQLNVDIPQSTKDGDYSMDVTADANGVASDTLTLSLTVSKTDVSQGSFTSQFPELQGGATTAFTFDASLSNNGGADRYYSLSAKA